ncbi:MAG: aminotransferase class IV [Verrucomicrobiota bacterium]
MEDSPLVWWNGRVLPEWDAQAPAISQGLLWGRGIFETLGVWDGQPFALTRHLERLRAAAARLKLEIPTDEAWREAIATLLAARQPRTARLRLTVTGGGHPGLSLDSGDENILIRLTPYEPVTTPAAVLTVPWRRNEFSALAGLKSTSYAENAIAMAWVRERDATEACFLNTGGDLCEGAASNLFLVKDGAVMTPSIGSGCLPGITRALVIELCEQLEIPCAVRAVTPREAVEADAIFLTSSLRGVQPVITLDNRACPADDPVTAILSAALERLRRTLPDP